MKQICCVFCVLILLIPAFSEQKKPSVNIEDLTWMEAEQVLKDYEVVLIALGARTKEHGPHLLLKNDFLMAEYLRDRVIGEVPVAVLPTLQYGYYPAFLEYPGSVSLKAETFTNVVIDICMSMFGYGIRKFYVLNTGVSTLRPLKRAAEELKKKGVVLRYFNILEADKKIPTGYLEQEGGTHADEGETSMMLYIAPETVDMSKAVRDYDARPNRRGLTRDPEGSGHYSPTGIWGDPTLATRKKGEVIVETTVKEIIKEVQALIDLQLEDTK
ncbi:MAG: creatininase family protein [Candidatus Aminicenantes bacterium]